MRVARRSGRLPARGAADHLAIADVSAHRLSAGAGLSVRSVGAQQQGPGRRSRAPPRLGRRRVPGLLSHRRRRLDPLQGNARSVVGDRALPVAIGWVRGHAAGTARPAGHAGRAADSGVRALRGQLRVGWQFCRRRDPQAKGAVERLQGYLETYFEPGRHFFDEGDNQAQLDGWFAKANQRTHKTLRSRPVDGLLRARGHAGAAGVSGPRSPLRDPGAGRSLPALRYVRLLARSAASRPRRRGPRLADRGDRGRAGPASLSAATSVPSRATG